MNLRITVWISLGLCSTGCSEVTTRPNVDHCTLNGGDQYCAERFEGRPYCTQGYYECSSEERYGCVAEVAPECHAPCGDPEDMSCLDGESSSSGSSSGGTEESESGSSEGMSSSTTGPECMENADCMDPAAPFCGGDGECVSCQAVSDPNGACAELDAAMPVCDAGTCVQCTGGQAGACTGQTPVCGGDNACVACTEHDQCPDSACHLDGELVGACFDVAEVVAVTNTAELTAALGELGATDRAVFVLGAGTYGATVDLGASNEVAILGQGGAPVLAGDGSRAVDVFSSAILYLDGVQVVNGSGDGVSCTGTSVWLDDSAVRNNSQVGMDVSGGCAAHLRRSVVRSNSAGGVEVAGGTSLLAMQNSVVADNVGPAAGPGVRATSAALDVVYSVLVSNGSFAAPINLECLSGAAGSVRNSIVSGPNGNSIVTCAALSWDTNAVDSAGIGAGNVEVGAYNGAWFVDPGTGNYHLATAGETTFMDIATWQPGDPLADVDGDPIPTDMPSFPGYDQP